MRICSCCSVAQSWPTLCNPIDCSMPGFLVLYYLLEFAQTYLHRGDDAIWTSPPMSSPSPPALSLSQNESFPMSWLFTSGDQSIGASASASVLPVNIQGWFPLGLTGLISLVSKGLSRVFSSTTVGKHQFFSVQPSLWSNSHSHRWLLKKPSLWLYGPLLAKWCLWFFNTLSRFVIAYHPRSKHLNFMAAVTVCSNFGAQENKVCYSSHFLPFYVPHNCTHLTH